MNIKSITLVIITLIFSASANAVLVSRLGGQAYYDTDADLTWLADANASVGSIYDTWNPGSGVMNWFDANNWAAGLTVSGVGGWRLPDTDEGCPLYNCTGSEMGSLFYNALGNSKEVNNSGGALSNTGPFSNVQTYWYWSATDWAPDTNWAWVFNMDSGKQLNGNKAANNLYVWVVQSGDVSAVPVPAAVWLFGSGLLGLIGFAKRKRKQTFVVMTSK
jgi:hypothetical protein